MIILQPNRELTRGTIEADEVELSKKLKDDVVIIPCEYDIVSLADTCELIEIPGTDEKVEDDKENYKHNDAIDGLTYALRNFGQEIASADEYFRNIANNANNKEFKTY